MTCKAVFMQKTKRVSSLLSSGPHGFSHLLLHVCVAARGDELQ